MLNGGRNDGEGITAPHKAVSVVLHSLSTTAGRLTAAGGSGRLRNSPSTPARNQIAAGGSNTAGCRHSSIAATGVAGGTAVRTHIVRRPAAAAGRLTAGGGGRRSNSPSNPTRNQIAAGGSITAGCRSSSIAAAGVAGGAAVRTHIARCPAAPGRLTAGGSGRHRISRRFPTSNQIAACTSITAGCGRSFSAVAGVASGRIVHTPEYRRPGAAACRRTAGGARRRNSPNPPAHNQTTAGGSVTAGDGRSSISRRFSVSMLCRMATA